jgi:ABC-type uncharacterized transport system auxiliary subunit
MIHLNQETIIKCKQSNENNTFFELTTHETIDNEYHKSKTHKVDKNNSKLWHNR